VSTQRTEPDAVGRASGPVVEPEPYDSPVAQRFVEALEADMVERYEVEVTAPGYEGEENAHWTVRPEQVTPPAGVFLVAWLDGEPVGSGAVRRLVSGDDPSVGEVKRMWTEPHARRRGVSRAVLARLEREARAFGYRRLQLETGDRQPEALALYESAGWHRIEPYGEYRDDPGSVCFAKDLAPTD
jgi:GNAT superfamily N-acetyltransferase